MNPNIAMTMNAYVTPQYVPTSYGASIVAVVILIMDVSTMTPIAKPICLTIFTIAEPCGISSLSSAFIATVVTGASVNPNPAMNRQKYSIIQYGELSMPTVFNKISEMVVIKNPGIMIRFPPYLSYKLPEANDMNDSKIVPGNNKKPDKNAVVPRTSCENIGNIVSVDNSSAILIKINIDAILNVEFLNNLTFRTGASCTS